MVTISVELKVAVLGPKIVDFFSRGSAPHPTGAAAPDPVYIRSGLPDRGPSP